MCYDRRRWRCYSAPPSISAALKSGQLGRLMPGLEIRIWPDIGDPAEIDYALVWRPEPGLLAALPNLKLILSLGAGIDHILCDPDLPAGVPITRLVDPYLTDAMSEYVVLQVLRLHRHDLDYRAQQHAGIWRELAQKNAGERPAGILGFGEIGQDAGAQALSTGFPGFRAVLPEKSRRRLRDIRRPRRSAAAPGRDGQDLSACCR